MSTISRPRAVYGFRVDLDSLIAPSRGCEHPESPCSFCEHCGAPMWVGGDVEMPKLSERSAGWARSGESATCLLGAPLGDAREMDGAWAVAPTPSEIKRARARLEALCRAHGVEMGEPQALLLPA